MPSPERSDETLRDAILRLLSRSEASTLASSATKARLANGDEYVDLQHPQHGVQHIRGNERPTGDVIVRKAIYEDTWRRVLRQLKDADSGRP